MNQNNKTENNDVYILEMEFKNDKTIKELIKELLTNAHIETDPETWYNKPII